MRAGVFWLVTLAVAVAGRLPEPRTNAAAVHTAAPAFVETQEKVLPIPPVPLVLGPIAASAASGLMAKAVSGSAGRRVSVPGLGGVVSAAQYLMDMRANQARHRELKAMYPMVLEQLRALEDSPELMLSRSVSNSVVQIRVVLGNIRKKLFPQARRRLGKLRTLMEYYDLYSTDKNIDDLQWQLSTVLQLLATEQGEQLKALVMSLHRFRLTLPRQASTTPFSESAAIGTLRSVEAASAAGADKAKQRMERFMGFRAPRVAKVPGGLFREDGSVDPRISAGFAKFVSRTLVDALQGGVNALADARRNRAAAALKRGLEEVLGPSHDGHTRLVRLLQRMYQAMDGRARVPLSPTARAYEVATLGKEVQGLLDEWKRNAESSVHDAPGPLARKNAHLWTSLAEAFSQTGVTQAAQRSVARDNASRAVCEAGFDTASAKCRDAQLVAAEACQRTEWYLLTMLQSVLAAPSEGAHAGTRSRLCGGNVSALETYLFRGREGSHPLSYIVQEGTTGGSYVDLCKYWLFNDLLGGRAGDVSGDEGSSQASRGRDSSTGTGHKDGASGHDDKPTLPDAFAAMPPASDEEGRLRLGQPEFAKHLEVYTSCHSHVQLASRIVLEMIALVSRAKSNMVRTKQLHTDTLVDVLVSMLFNIGMINHCAARILVESRSDRNGPRLLHMAEQSVWSILTAESVSGYYGIVVANVNDNALVGDEDVDSRDMDRGQGSENDEGSDDDDSNSRDEAGSPDSSAGADGSVSEAVDAGDGSSDDAGTGAEESPQGRKNDPSSAGGVLKSLYDSAGRPLAEEEVWLFVEKAKGRVIAVEPLAAIFSRLRAILLDDNFKTKTSHWKMFVQLWHGLIEVYGSLVTFDRSRMLLRESMLDIVWSGKEMCTLKIRDADSKCLSYGGHLDITCGGSVWAAQLSKAVSDSGSENLVGVKSLEGGDGDGIWDDSAMLADAIVGALDLATLHTE